MTAVEYLVEQLLPKALSAEQYYHIEQAKEMEKQQIMDIFDDGCQWGYERQPYNAENYYNEKFKK